MPYAGARRCAAQQTDTRRPPWTLWTAATTHCPPPLLSIVRLLTTMTETPIPLKDSPSRALPGRFVCGLLIGGAFLVRLAVLQNDLWLDEVWSVEAASGVASPLDIVTAIHHDNNHYLNTLWLWFCGSDAAVWQQRLLSLLTGTACVALAGCLAARFGRTPAVLAMLLTAGSLVFVQYSTEARGYAPALCAALAAHGILRRHLRDRDLKSGLAFSICCLLGVLSHLSFLQYEFAAVFWTAAMFAGDRGGAAAWVRRMLACHGVAVLGMAVLYAIDIRHLTFGGGPRLEALSVLQNAVSVFAGGPLDHPARLLWVVLVVGGVAAGVRGISRGTDGHEWKFFACLFLLFPLFRVILLPPSMMFERYFLIPLGFAVIPLSIAAAGMLRQSSPRRAAAGLLLACFLVGNAAWIRELQESGRGSYAAVLAMMAEHSQGVLRATSDHPFRNRLLLEYYASRTADNSELQYVDLGEWESPPEWMICHQIPREPDPPVDWFDGSARPRQRIRVCGFAFELQCVTRTASLSGCRWLCYRLAERPGTDVAQR